MSRAPYICSILIAFIFNSIGTVAQAQELSLPMPGTLVHLSPAFVPAILKGIKVHPDNPFKFEFVMDKGDGYFEGNGLKPFRTDTENEAKKLIKYFLASLTVPEKDLWVNLSPYEKNRIVPDAFGKTEMGRDLLALDYMLKQITASLIYPEDETGKSFWQKVYAEARRKGVVDVPINTFNKVWIVPEKAVVYENTKAGTAYVVESKLKVMLEEDYLALDVSSRAPQGRGDLLKNDKKIASSSSTSRNDTHSIASQIVREVVIPQLTHEINTGRNFAQLRQVYNSLILATWYKKKIKDSILAQVYADKNKVKGVEYKNSVIASAAKQSSETELIYQHYLQAFKKGAYNYIKEEQDPVTQQMIPRKYFSGGMGFAGKMAMMVNKEDPAMIRGENADNDVLVNVNMRPERVALSDSSQLVSLTEEQEGILHGLISRITSNSDIKNHLGNRVIAGSEIIILKKAMELTDNEEQLLWFLFHKNNESSSNRDYYLVNDDVVQRYIQEHEGQVAILDIGSGPHGRALLALKYKWGEKVSATGIDMDIDAGSQVIPGVKLVRGDIRKMEFLDNSFHIINESYVMEYFNKLDDFIEVLSEMIRVLKNDGIFIFSDNNPFKDEKILEIILGELGYLAEVKMNEGKIYIKKKAIVSAPRQNILNKVREKIYILKVQNGLKKQIEAIRLRFIKIKTNFENEGHSADKSTILLELNSSINSYPKGTVVNKINTSFWRDIGINDIDEEGRLTSTAIDNIEDKIRQIIDADSSQVGSDQATKPTDAAMNAPQMATEMKAAILGSFENQLYGVPFPEMMTQFTPAENLAIEEMLNKGVQSGLTDQLSIQNLAASLVHKLVEEKYLAMLDRYWNAFGHADFNIKGKDDKDVPVRVSFYDPAEGHWKANVRALSRRMAGGSELVLLNIKLLLELYNSFVRTRYEGAIGTERDYLYSFLNEIVFHEIGHAITTNLIESGQTPLLQMEGATKRTMQAATKEFAAYLSEFVVSDELHVHPFSIIPEDAPDYYKAALAKMQDLLAKKSDLIQYLRAHEDQIKAKKERVEKRGKVNELLRNYTGSIPEQVDLIREQMRDIFKGILKVDMVQNVEEIRQMVFTPDIRKYIDALLEKPGQQITTLGIQDFDEGEENSVQVSSDRAMIKFVSRDSIRPENHPRYLGMRIAEAVNAGIAFGTPFGLVTQTKKVDSPLGGIDLTSDKAMQIKNDGQGGIQFHISAGGGSAFGGDQAMLAQLQNAPGFTPEIINIQPMTDLKVFLGI